MSVALIARQGKFLVAEPFFGTGPRVVVSRDTRYAAGDLVELTHVQGGRRGARAKVRRRIGSPNVARDVIEALILDRGLRRGFDGQVNKAASVAAQSSPSHDGRRDLRDLPTLTIDPRSARDFDDAISAQEEPNGEGWRVWVHIADVTAYVHPRDPVDRVAFARGTSVYLPGTVEPMLPAELSNGVCSLVAGEDRLTVTVEFVVSPAGRLRSPSFYRSVIRSGARLDYDQVDRLFSGGAPAGAPPAGSWNAALASARAAARALADDRADPSALTLDSAEPEFEFDRAGNVVAMRQVIQTESHRLIEQLMIAANEQVAAFLSTHKLPTLYRVHERPEPESVIRAIDQLASLGVPTPPVPKGVMSPTEAEELAGRLSHALSDWLASRDRRGSRALNRIVLRSLAQAHYEHVNRGHSGLHLANYCHFTSPIRRYPDVIAHRSLLSAIAGEPVLDPAWVAQAGPLTSEAERRAMVLERDGDDIARCFLLARRLGEHAVRAGGRSGGAGRPSGRAGEERDEFTGEVVGLIAAGAFVAFGDDGEFEGLLPVRRMGGDWWELNEERTALVGSRSGQALRLGDSVDVRVERIDRPRGRVDLAWC